jgi:hypothetical protein
MPNPLVLEVSVHVSNIMPQAEEGRNLRARSAELLVISASSRDGDFGAGRVLVLNWKIRAR